MTQNSDATRLPDDRFELLDIAYEHTPWFRRRWFIGLTLLLFMPLTLCLVLSGDVYLKRQGLVYKMLPKQKRVNNHYVLYFDGDRFDEGDFNVILSCY